MITGPANGLPGIIREERGAGLCMPAVCLNIHSLRLPEKQRFSCTKRQCHSKMYMKNDRKTCKVTFKLPSAISSNQYGSLCMNKYSHNKAQMRQLRAYLFAPQNKDHFHMYNFCLKERFVHESRNIRRSRGRLRAYNNHMYKKWNILMYKNGTTHLLREPLEAHACLWVGITVTWWIQLVNGGTACPGQHRPLLHILLFQIGAKTA